MKSKFYWTEEKEKELIKKWGSYSPDKLASYFHTTRETINKKKLELGLDDYKSNRWTPEEEELLRQYAKKYVTKTIARKLGRSYIAVQKKAIKLGIELHSEVDPWKKWMIDYLKDNINKKPIGEIESILGLSYHKILKKCKELGIEYIKEYWTDEEIETLRKYAKTCHYTELTKVLPKRSIGAISAKAFELGIETISDYEKLNDEDAKFIKDNWGKIPVAEIARKLKISIGVVYRYKRKLGLPNVGQKKRWTEEIIEKIRKDAKKMTRSELAKKYKTSPTQISNIAQKNNIKLIDSKKNWTDELDQKLIELVDKKLSVSEIASEMKMKASLIRKRICDLGLAEKKVRNPKYIWTEEQVELLKLLSNEKTIDEIAEVMSKTEKQIYDKAKKLGLTIKSSKHHLWTEEETKQLIYLHDKYEMHIIAQVMDRSEEVIRSKAKELGLFLRFKPRRSWTPEEEKQLEEYAKEFMTKEIGFFLNRSVASVGSKLSYMGLSAQPSPKFWTEEEIKQLIDLSHDNDIENIASIMNKSYESITYKLYELGIKAKIKSNKLWSKEEEELLLELLTTYSSFDVAKMLDRSEEAIIVRALKLGYDVDSRHKRWTKEEELLLLDLWGKESIEKISKKLNRTYSAIINRVYILGLGSQIENNYEGLRIRDIERLFKVNRNMILTSWVALGLKLDFRRRSNNSIYSFVQISNLYEFLENNQNIWDSRYLEENILGEEPEWLQEKRKLDKNMPIGYFGLGNLAKQQLIQEGKYFLDSSEDGLQQSENAKVYSLVKKKN